MDGQVSVLVATNAFRPGIDQPDTLHSDVRRIAPRPAAAGSAA